MTEKYIDLVRRIREEVNYDHDAILTIAAVLNWLDDHPDQAPGRTITAGKFERAWADSVDQDARNMFPRALNALEQVLEQVEFMETDAEAIHHEARGQAYEVLLDYAHTLREAIEGAINHE